MRPMWCAPRRTFLSHQGRPITSCGASKRRTNLRFTVGSVRRSTSTQCFVVRYYVTTSCPCSGSTNPPIPIPTVALRKGHFHSPPLLRQQSLYIYCDTYKHHFLKIKKIYIFSGRSIIFLFFFFKKNYNNNIFFCKIIIIIIIIVL